LPVGFSLNNEVLAIVKSAGSQGIHGKRILAEMHERFPKYGIDRKRVASALAYLKNTRKEIGQVGRGVYKAVEKST
jgi:transposase